MIHALRISIAFGNRLGPPGIAPSVDRRRSMPRAVLPASPSLVNHRASKTATPPNQVASTPDLASSIGRERRNKYRDFIEYSKFQIEHLRMLERPAPA